MRFIVSAIMDFIVMYIRPADFADFLHLFIVSKEHVVGFIFYYNKAHMLIMYTIYKVNIREKFFLS